MRIAPCRAENDDFFLSAFEPIDSLDFDIIQLGGALRPEELVNASIVVDPIRGSA